MTQRAIPRSEARRRRLTLRTRLTLSYAGLITGSGAILITLVYLYMRFVPTYRIVSDAAHPGAAPSGPSGRTDGIAIVKADDFLDNLIVASILALLLMTLIGATVGWLIARRIVKPLSDIGDAARRATEGSLEHRVGLNGPPDEIQTLADAFDQMLASLERSFAAQRRFTANASHELQSPLATIKTMIDVTRSNPSADPADLRGLIDRISEVNQSNIETVDAMLDLATAAHAAALPEPVDLVALAQTVVTGLNDDAASFDVEIEGPTGSATAWGDPVLLRQAVSNLVRNAIHHNHRGGRASISVASSRGRVRLIVWNTGPTVALANLETLKEPFARGAGRSLTRGSGHGLGLAIADAAMAAHGGRLDLAPNAEGGLTATLDIPSADVRAEARSALRI
ncbi:sensor histidine kinase [Microbacterium cremeum]|uniref:sensor histidine kinase n=1 Tax=Microbacterium cremeum TaxID=2782169 RepID=UPI001888BF9F|nr:HAMP domain-containing sensor histidine kinase [Microbacterium cremeum]